MGIVRLRKGKSTGHCEAKALSDKEIGKLAAHDMSSLRKNARWNDTLKVGPPHECAVAARRIAQPETHDAGRGRAECRPPKSVPREMGGVAFMKNPS
jgi:hypothetical protein